MNRDLHFVPTSWMQGIFDCKEFCLFFDSLANPAAPEAGFPLRSSPDESGSPLRSDKLDAGNALAVQYNYGWLSSLRIATPCQGKKVHIPPPNLGGIKRRSIFSGTRPYMSYAECLQKYCNPPEADKRSGWDFYDAIIFVP